MGAGASFACPPDCGWCCTHLDREVPDDEAEAAEVFRDAMRELGVYACADGASTGLSLSPGEAADLRAEAQRRGMAVDIHPRTFLLETRRRLVVPLDWHLAHASCPFYLDFKCTAYTLRPLVCRAFPVLSPSPRWRLAPQCPVAEPTLEARDRGELKLGAFLRDESRARHAMDAQHARLDDATMALLDAPGLRFAKGLDATEAQRRARAWRVATVEEALALVGPA